MKFGMILSIFLLILCAFMTWRDFEHAPTDLITSIHDLKTLSQALPEGKFYQKLAELSVKKKGLDLEPKKRNHVIVYGSINCEFTKSLISELNKNHIPFDFKNYFDKKVQKELGYKLIRNPAAIMNIGTPMVDVDENLLNRPDFTQVLRALKTAEENRLHLKDPLSL